MGYMWYESNKCGNKTAHQQSLQQYWSPHKVSVQLKQLCAQSPDVMTRHGDKKSLSSSKNSVSPCCPNATKDSFNPLIHTPQSNWYHECKRLERRQVCWLIQRNIQNCTLLMVENHHTTMSSASLIRFGMKLTILSVNHHYFHFHFHCLDLFPTHVQRTWCIVFPLRKDPLELFQQSTWYY